MQAEEARLIIENQNKPIMIGKSGQNIKLVQRYSKVKLSAYSKSLQQAVFFGRRSELHDAIKEFISKFDFSLIKKFQSFFM